MAASKLILSVLVIYAVYVRELSAVSLTCMSSEIPLCWGNMTNRYQSFPSLETTEGALSTYCSDVKALCSNTLNMCMCGLGDLPNTCRDFMGLKDAVQYLCNYTDVRTLYQNNRQCIVNNTDTVFSSCRTTYGTTSCTAYNSVFRCFYNGMKSACSTDVAKMMTQFQLKRSGPLLSYSYSSCTIDASSYEGNSGGNSGGDSSGTESSADVIVPSVVSVVVAATVLIQLIL